MKAKLLARGGGMLAAIVLAAAWLSAPAKAQGSGSATLDAVRARGVLLCGTASNEPGFALADSQGVIRGIDADSCRAVAAAVLGDATKIKFVPTTTQNRFTALQSGEVDLLARRTTWTLSREGNLGLSFAWVNYYDGTGFLVKKSSGVKALKEMDGATICVQPGTSTELAISDYFRQAKMTWQPILIQDLNEMQSAFMSGRCDAYSTDSSALASFRFTQGAKADDLVLLPDIISKEPLGVMVRKGDDKWFDIVRWTFIALLTGEELGVTQANVDDQLKSDNPNVRRLLGVEGDLGKALALDNKWAYFAIKAVGNFGEIWDRDITPMGVPRGLNNLWTKGGLQYPPPIR